MAKNGVRVEIKGLNDLLAKLEKLGDAADAALGAAAEAGAEELKRRMIPNAPGPHIEVELRYLGGGRVIYDVGPDKAHFYYRFFETGTARHMVLPRRMKALKFGGRYAAKASAGGMAAKPFMRPAVDEGQDKVKDAMGDVLKKAVKGV